MREIVECIDSGTEFCPCKLAEAGECIICSQLQGSCFCDCLNWKGVCIYHEFINNGSKAKEGRKTYNCLVKETELCEKDLLLIKFEVPHKLAIDLVKAFSNEKLGLDDETADKCSFLVQKNGEVIDGENYVKVIAAEKKETDDGTYTFDIKGEYYISFDGDSVLKKVNDNYEKLER